MRAHLIQNEEERKKRGSHPLQNYIYIYIYIKKKKKKKKKKIADLTYSLYSPFGGTIKECQVGLGVPHPSSQNLLNWF